MKSIKDFINLFLVILLIIFVYNFIMPFYTTMNSGGMRMGMGMHGGRGFSNNNILLYNNISTFIFVFLILIVSFVLVNKIMFNSNSLKCKNCGFQIENDRWKICPHCGQRLL